MNALHKVNGYMQLVLAKDSDIWEDMCATGYSDLSDHYTLAVEEESYENVYAEHINIDYVAKTKVVALIGSRGCDCRCHSDERTVYVAKDKTVWMLDTDFEEYFS